jgi:ADP-ribose pyrophosphatase YjhB (NUDIX family)
MRKPRRVGIRLIGSSWRVRFFEDTIKSPVGNPQKFARFQMPDYALVVATRKSDGKIPLVKQYRNGAQDHVWEFPAGFLEDGESPQDCIKREFREEVGYKLEGKPKFIASVFVSPGRTNQRAHIFLGNVGRRATQNLDDGEQVEVKFVSKKKVLKLLKENERISSCHLLAYFLSR